jgi:putative nucleotidyltransferase with HDIG domain
MNREEFQSISMRILNSEASDTEIQRHELLCNTEDWAKPEFVHLKETHQLLVGTLPHLADGFSHQDSISSKTLNRLMSAVRSQHPLAGTTADVEIYENLVRKIKKLPTLPIVLNEIHKALHKEDANVLDVEELMSGDKSLTTTVLRVANSAHFGLPQRVYSLNQAISIMGFNDVQQIVLTASVISSFDNVSNSFFTLHNFWRHSIGVALATSRIGQELGIRGEDRILYTCGLLHDIGKVGNLLLDTKGYLQLIQKSMETGDDLDHLEKEEVFPEHSMLGEAICERWQLPSIIHRAIRFHHEPDTDKRGFLPEEINQTADCIYLADQIVRENQFGYSGNAGPTTPARAVLDRLGLHAIRLEQIRGAVEEELEEAHGLLDILPREAGVA